LLLSLILSSEYSLSMSASPSYEEFMEEYVAFMKKYSEDPNNAIVLLGDYAAIMEKYTDFAEKIDQYDQKDMSTADAKYYLEVVNRCNQKLLDVY